MPDGTEDRHTAPSIAVAGVPAFELHSLGWRAFQDLCVAVLREVWDCQSLQAFADSNDGGRDGAFHGLWRPAPCRPDLPDGPFVLQCKFTARRDETLTLSIMRDELSKVRSLVERGLCRSYMLLTNARVTGESQAAINAALKARGVEYPETLGGSWLNQTIAKSRKLRMFVPRVYGLGDLSQILDERAYEQAKALLEYLKEDLSTFVVTDAYHRAAAAIRDYGFCLLLGEPAAGKSIIAATLAMTALDNWKCLTVRADGPGDIVRHWNPNEKHQFFWVDDAFGAVRHERALSDEWSRSLSKIMAAVNKGAKIILTSRDYIYREARPLLKEYAYPLLREQQVVVNVAALSPLERQQILYNHIRLGDQPKATRRKLKPHLEAAAGQLPFRPEVARRLGRQMFTTNLQRTRSGVLRFMSQPNDFLGDVYEGLEPDYRAALALVYQSGDLLVPFEIADSIRQKAMTQLGGTPGGVSRALNVLEGTFLRRAPIPGSGDPQEYWSFRHPTLREGFAAFIAKDPNLVQIVVDGLSDKDLLTQVDCGGEEKQGTLVSIPPVLYRYVAKRVAAAWASPHSGYAERWQHKRQWYSFLATKCSRQFLAIYLEIDPELLDRLVRFYSYLFTQPEIDVLARLHELSMLPESYRQHLLNKVTYLATETPDADWIWMHEFTVLITEAERVELLEHVQSELIPNLEKTLDDWQFNEQEDIENYYGPLEEALDQYAEELRGDESSYNRLKWAIEKVDELRTEALLRHEEKNEDTWTSEGQLSSAEDPFSLRSPTPEETSDRSVFDDVDEER